MRSKVSFIQVRAEDLMEGDVALLPVGGRVFMWRPVLKVELPKEDGREYTDIYWRSILGQETSKAFNRYEPIKIQFLTEL